MSIFNKVSSKKGKKIWEKLNAELPKAYGVVCDDVPRMKKFAELVTQMSRKEKASLKLFLEELLAFYSEEDLGCVSMRTEEMLSRKRQICCEHLNYL